MRSKTATMDEGEPAIRTSNDPNSALPPLTSHPRRPPAHKSVSLKHSRENTPQVEEPASTVGSGNRKARGRPPVSNRATLGPSLSSIPAVPDKTVSSGESSNADKWFEKSNNNVRTGSADLTEMDNDPPFFLRNSSSSETSPDMLGRERANQQALDSLPHRTGLMHLGTAASSSEDFRSVIDDLTVQNKKLKRKLKKYEKLHDSHLNAEKLFEIRVHGLAPHKKRELEETLRKFAAGLEGAPAPKTNSSGRGSSHQQTSLPASIEQQLTAGSSLGNVDSAYASASGQNSSGQGSIPAIKKDVNNSNNNESSMKAGMSTAQQRDIQTYLSDIPQGLLPKPIAMTEKSKKKLIVRRLEQIFAGKGASKSGHQHPMQQQEISQSAAQADRSEREATGRHWNKEGAREARIMRSKRRSLQAEAELQAPPPQPKPLPKITKLEPTNSSGKGENSPDQRPTRPLDLDPERAQVPADNIKYLRHLGFSPLEAGSDEQLVDGHGYMYLNVLINMAQLHTLNVTPEFVKRAVEQFSKKLELSSDGRKVRWRGGSDLTRSSSNGSPDDNSNASGQLSHVDCRKKSLLASASGDGSSTSLSKSGKASKDENKLAYIPLFFHQDEEDDSDSDDMSEWSSPHEELVPANSSGLNSSGMHTTSSKKKQANDGPIIFYNKAPFVTDLSGDWRGANVKTVNMQDYASFPVHAVGIARPTNLCRVESRGPLSKQDATVADSDPMDTDGIVSGDSVHGFSKPSSMKTTGSSSDDSPDPIEFEASGVGGVHPSDNFALNIKSRHKLVRELSTATRTKNYPPYIRAILADSATSSSSAAQSRDTAAEILTSKRKDLPPSELPPPSYFPMSSPEDEDEYSDSDDDDDDDDDDDEDDELFDTPVYSDRQLPSSALRTVNFPKNAGSDVNVASDDDEHGSIDDDSDDSDDSDGSESPDMLAHARKANPELIRLAEREYDAGLAERLAKDIPAGSSAATAGGGSGFNSPVTPDNMDVDGLGTSSQQARCTSGGKNLDGTVQQPQRGILKRARPTDGGRNQQRSSKSPKLETPAGPVP